MKKYLITSAAALALCGLITSCSHDIDGLTPEESVAATYEKAFITAFGQPAPDQTWGFGTSASTSRAMTRGSMPTKPTFRDGTEGMPDFSKPEKPSFYNTVAEAEAAGVTVVVAGANTEPQANTTYAISNNTSFNNLQNQSGITLYVTENMKFAPSFSAGGNTIVVTRDTKLTLGGVLNEKVNVYLAPNAELILPTYEYKNIIYWPEYKEETVSTDAYSFNNNSSETPYKLYLSSGSKITGGSIQIDNGYQVLNDGGTINSTSIRVQKSTLWNEGEIELSGDLTTYNGDANIYNAAGKKITVKGKLELTNNNDLLYNNGEINITGNIRLKDGSTQIVNNNKLKSSGDLDMTAGGAFHNVGNAEISGHSYIYNTNSYWVNDGHFKTGTFEDRNCEQVFNNCHMIVTGNFSVGGNKAEDQNGHAYFVMEGGSEDADQSGAYLFCDSFTFGDDPDVFLGNKAFIEVTNSLLTTNNDSPYGIHGPSSGSYAVIKAASFTKQGNPYISMTYFGNLYIDTPTHYAKGTDDINPYYRYDTSVKFSFNGDNSPVSIPKTNCNPGYNTDIEPTGDVVRVVAEDLTASAGNDFDFNDVVFDVELKDNNVVYVYVRAAGGTLPLYLGEEDEAVEVHGLFGQDTGIMINTGGTTKGYANCIDNLAPKGISLRNPLAGQADATNVRQVAKAIKVTVIKKVNGTSTPCLLKAEQGEATAKLCVGTDYQYTEGGKTYPCLTERTDIQGKFIYESELNSEYRLKPKFPLYVKGVFGDDWYKSTAEPK